MDADSTFMQLALEEASAAAVAGEVPIGALMVRDGASDDHHNFVGESGAQGCSPSIDKDKSADRIVSAIALEHRV